MFHVKHAQRVSLPGRRIWPKACRGHLAPAPHPQHDIPERREMGGGSTTAHYGSPRSYYNTICQPPPRRMTIKACIKTPRAAPASGRPARPFMPIHDPPLRQIVGRQLHPHPVTQQHTNIVLPHPPRQIRQHLVLVVKPDPEIGVRQSLDHLPFQNQLLILLSQLRSPPGTWGKFGRSPPQQSQLNVRQYTSHSTEQGSGQPRPIPVHL